MEIHRISSDVVRFVCTEFPRFDVYIEITDSRDIKTAKNNLREFIDTIRREQKFTDIEIK